MESLLLFCKQLWLLTIKHSLNSTSTSHSIQMSAYYTYTYYGTSATI